MNKFMKEAIAEATKGVFLGHGGPFGAVIVKQNKDGIKEIVGRGHNRVIKENNPTRHGEMVAIADATKNLGTFDLTGCDIYTTGEPCPMCLGALMWANINNIFYGCTIEDNEKIGFRDNKFNDIMSIKRKTFYNMYQIERDACLELFDMYNKINNKKSY